MQAHNIMIGHPNRIDVGSLNPSAGRWLPSLPAANVQYRQIAKVARTVDAGEGAAVLEWDFGLPKRTRIMAAINHNLTFTGRWRILAARDAGFTQIVYDSGTLDAWAGVVGTTWRLEELDWLTDNFWLGSLNREQMEGFTATALHILPGNVTARYWRVAFMDPRNPAGYLQVGRIFVGEVEQPTINYAWGASVGYEDTTVVQRSLGGSMFFDRREPLRVFRFALQYMNDEEGFARFLEIVRRAGTSGEVFVVPDPTDQRHGLRRNFMGHLRQLSPLEQVTWVGSGSAHSMAFEIEELR